MSRQNTLKVQLLGGISLRQDRLVAITNFVQNPYGDGASDRWLSAVEALISFNNDAQYILVPATGLSIIIGTMPGGTVWYYSQSKNNSYENFLKATISDNRNVRGSFQQVLNNDSEFGYEVLLSTALAPVKATATESRVTMRLGDNKSNVIGVIGLSCVI